MGPIATAVLGGCLNALQWLLWFSAALAALTAVLTHFRGDSVPSPAALLILALALAAIGWVCGWAAKKLTSART